MLYCCLVKEYEYDVSANYHFESDLSPKEATFKFINYLEKKIDSQCIPSPDYFNSNDFWEDEPEGEDGDWYLCGNKHGEIFVCPVETIRLKN